MLWSQRYIKSKCKVLYLLVRRRFILRLLTLVPHCLCLRVPKRDIRSLSVSLSLSLYIYIYIHTHTHTHTYTHTHANEGKTSECAVVWVMGEGM